MIPLGLKTRLHLLWINQLCRELEILIDEGKIWRPFCLRLKICLLCRLPLLWIAPLAARGSGNFSGSVHLLAIVLLAIVPPSVAALGEPVSVLSSCLQPTELLTFSFAAGCTRSLIAPASPASSWGGALHPLPSNMLSCQWYLLDLSGDWGASFAVSYPSAEQAVSRLLRCWRTQKFASPGGSAPHWFRVRPLAAWIFL